MQSILEHVLKEERAMLAMLALVVVWFFMQEFQAHLPIPTPINSTMGTTD
jgi:hypothetical protein